MSDKPVAKTPDDVREALKHLMAEYGAEVMAKVELGNTELLAELCEQATEELLDKHIQPLIEAAKTERDEYWKDKITTYITSDVRRLYHGC